LLAPPKARRQITQILDTFIEREELKQRSIHRRHVDDHHRASRFNRDDSSHEP